MQNRSSEMRFNLLLRQIRTQTYQDYTSTWPSKRRFCNITSIFELLIPLLLQLRRPHTRLPLQARQAAPAIISSNGENSLSSSLEFTVI